jgi:hypothetical protein
MEMKLNIPFNQLLALVRQLSPVQKQKLQKELQSGMPGQKDNDFKSFLLTGPVFSKAQLKTIEETRKL